MASVKLIALASTISAFLCCLILMWNEDATTCGVTTCKVLETMFFICTLGCYSMYRDINWSGNKDK